MSNNVQAIQTKWAKLYNEIKQYINDKRVRSLQPIFVEKQDIIENINTNILNISTLDDDIFYKIEQSLSRLQNIFNNHPHSSPLLNSSIMELNNLLISIQDKNYPNIIANLHEQSSKHTIDIGKLFKRISKQEQILENISKDINSENFRKIREELEELQTIGRNQIDEQNKNFDTLSQTLQENINRIDIEMKNIHFVYDEQYKKLSNSLITYNMFFVVSLVVFFSISVYLFNDILSQSNLLDKNSDLLSNLSFVATTLLIKLPFLIPFIWLSIFFSNRRAEIHRLQQEYLHKSTFAQSYLKYEEQIKNLPENKQGDLLATLLDKLIETVYFNPSTTLDKKANKDISLEDVYNCLEKERTHFEKIRDFFKKDDGSKEKEKEKEP